jgi:hypothetical protein
MRKYTFILAVILFTASCEKQDEYIPLAGKEKPADVIVSQLTDAYEHNSVRKLKDILSEWEDENKARVLSGLENDIEKDIYKIFKIIYRPFNISSLGWHEWGEMYEDVNYVIVQNQVFYNFAYGEDIYERTDTVKDFRPPLSFEGKTILYLTSNYHKAIYEFLQTEYAPLGTTGVMSPASPTGESRDRLEFLWNFLYILPGHWGGYYHIETHPEVEFIEFNTTANLARAYFRVGYMFGEAEFGKTNGEWEMFSSAITAIE